MKIFENLELSDDVSNILESALVLSVVILLILFFGWLLRRFFYRKSFLSLVGQKGRLSVKEAVNIDTRTRLVLCAFEDREYLLLISEGQSLVIDGYIQQKYEDKQTEDEQTEDEQTEDKQTEDNKPEKDEKNKKQ